MDGVSLYQAVIVAGFLSLTGQLRAFLLEEENLLENVKSMGEYLMDKLHGLQAKHKCIGQVRGLGLFQGLELVADRETKEPFPASLKLFQKIREQAFENGLICYPMGGNVDGINGDVLILAPPYNATDAELEEICSKLGKSVKQVLARI